MTLNEAKEILSTGGVENPLFDARMIFANIGKIPEHLLIDRSTATDSESVKDAILRRSRREPLQYIIGEVDFYREKYTVTPDCLIPRADTETLVDFAVKSLPDGAKFLDLCTGSGCIAISVLNNTESTRAAAVDVSDAAIGVAKKNAQRNGVSERVDFFRLNVLDSAVDGEFFAVLSNPPYVSESAYRELEPEIYREPSIAFVGGEDGGDFYRALTPLYRDRISDEGFIAYEIGYDQAELLTEIAQKNRMSIEILRDLSGNPRVAVLRKSKR